MVRSGLAPLECNKHAEETVFPNGEGDDPADDKFMKFLKSDASVEKVSAPLTNIQDLAGKSFSMDLDNGEKPRATIVEAIKNHDNKVSSEKEHVKFRCSVNDDACEEIMSCHKALDYISHDANTDIEWSFKKTLSHEGPLTKESPNYKGSTCNVMIEWENGEITAEPLSAIGKDAPAVCAAHA